jgi:hypothetical protein
VSSITILDLNFLAFRKNYLVWYSLAYFYTIQTFHKFSKIIQIEKTMSLTMMNGADAAVDVGVFSSHCFPRRG